MQEDNGSEQKLRNLLVSQSKVADIQLQRDNIKDALTLYQASLKTCKQILDNYGQSEQRLRDVMISCFKIACCFAEKNQWRWLQQALRYNVQRLNTFPQYAQVIMNEHELLLEFSAKCIEPLNDADLNAQLFEFLEHYAAFKAKQ